MSSIFICYRREDSSGHAGRLYDRLAERFGADRVFMDVEGIEAGVDFPDAIQRALATCEALVVVIGPHWAELEDDDGRRRLDDREDFVRREIEAALERGMTVVPALVRGAAMPAPDRLPGRLSAMARRQAQELSDARWAFDVKELGKRLENILDGPEADDPSDGAWTAFGRRARRGFRRNRRVALAALAILLVAAVAAGGLALSGGDEQLPAYVAQIQQITDDYREGRATLGNAIETVDGKKAPDATAVATIAGVEEQRQQLLARVSALPAFPGQADLAGAIERAIAADGAFLDYARSGKAVHRQRGIDISVKEVEPRKSSFRQEFNPLLVAHDEPVIEPF